VLHELAQQALRVGKRAHAETGIDAAGASVVSEALTDAEAALGGLAGRRALVVGAGSMGALTAAHLRRGGVDDLVLANRSEANAERLAVALRTEGATARAVGLGALAAEIAAADLVVACTGAVGTVVGEDDVRRGLAGRDTGVAPLVVCDLGLPRDVDPRIVEIAGVTVVDLAALGERLRSASAGIAVEEARTVVAEEVRAYFAAQRTAEVTPTVTALRRRAAEVVDAELLRLDGRMPDLDERSRSEVAQTVRRVVDKLLHTPTVQVKRLAQHPGGDTYAEALRELFELDPQTPAVLAATESSTRTASVEPGDEVDQALAVDTRGPGGRR
jgi:glutamyl-tRNA reductase